MNYIHIFCDTDNDYFKCSSVFLIKFCSNLNLIIESGHATNAIHVDKDTYCELKIRYNMWCNQQNIGWLVTVNIEDDALNIQQFNTLKEARQRAEELVSEGYFVTITFGYIY